MRVDTLLALSVFMTTAFLGSWHCGVMCGPVAVSLGRSQKLFSYHLGRFISYFSVGVTAGALGEKIVTSDFQIKILGVLFLSILLLGNQFQFFGPLQRKMGHRLKPLQKGSGNFIFGLFSVFLPCHRLWMFVFAAAATGSAWAGGLVTGTLWLSSIPVLSTTAAYFRTALPMLNNGRVVWVSRLITVAGLYSLWTHLI